jgi:N-methylhydantoinase A
MALQVGVDTGGTFTDVCLFDDEVGTMTVVKVSSTPGDPGEAVIAGVRAALAAAEGSRQRFDAIAYFAHGTTVATNALLQGRGAKVGLITTAGLRDLLELGRQRRPRLYDLSARKPETLVSRDLRREVAERVDYRGEVVTPLDLEDVRIQAIALREAGVEAVAVCLLYSFLRPEHELAIERILAEELPGIFTSVSHRVLPEFREFERLSTTAVNAFIGPVMKGYLGRLRTRLGDEGLAVLPKVTQSNGGVISFPQAEDFPVRTVLSGPSTGVVGAARIAEASGFPDIITFDMGGTSSDISVVSDARPIVARGTVLDGRPIQAPMLDISTVGAGGGSIAWIDDGGHLKVGPQSAGADPGPACYGLGNDQPTVTDANVVLGILNQELLLGGSMHIDAALSFAAVERLGAQIGLTAVEAAQGIISVVTANMAKAIRLVSVQRGYDPADYALVAFGGAGPLHSGRLAAELGMPHILVPPVPGALSAIGMLMTDLRTDYTRTRRRALDAANAPTILAGFADLEAEAGEWFERERIAETGRHVRRIADVRYKGQNYEIAVDLPETLGDTSWVSRLREAFEAEHERRYGYRNSEAVEVVTFRVEATGDVPRAQLRAHPPRSDDIEAAVVGRRAIYLPEFGARVDSPVIDRARLGAGHRVDGPAVIEQYDATTFILPGQVARVDDFGVLVVTAENPAAADELATMKAEA